MSTCLTARFPASAAVDQPIEIELRVRSTDARLAAALLDISRRAVRLAAAYALEEGGLAARNAAAVTLTSVGTMATIFKGNTK